MVSLPFSFQGESNQFDEALPFGIGSNSGGVPYEVEKIDANLLSWKDIQSADSKVKTKTTCACQRSSKNVFRSRGRCIWNRIRN